MIFLSLSGVRCGAGTGGGAVFTLHDVQGKGGGGGEGIVEFLCIFSLRCVRRFGDGRLRNGV